MRPPELKNTESCFTDGFCPIAQLTEYLVTLVYGKSKITNCNLFREYSVVRRTKLLFDLYDVIFTVIQNNTYQC